MYLSGERVLQRIPFLSHHSDLAESIETEADRQSSFFFILPPTPSLTGNGPQRECNLANLAEQGKVSASLTSDVNVARRERHCKVEEQQGENALLVPPFEQQES